MTKVITSIRIDKEDWKAMKHLVIEKGTTLSQYLSKKIKEELEQQ